MDDTISRQAAIDAINSHFGFNIDEEYGSAVQEVINGLPSAQPERKKGHWTEANTHTFGIYECDVCKGWTYIPNKPSEYNFCPRCGADMREGEDDG